MQHFSQNPEAVAVEFFEPWAAVNRELMLRAVERGESTVYADIELACQVINSIASYRGLVQRKTFDVNFYRMIIDGILLPAFKKTASISGIFYCH
ncbi:TetR-like C-terminal domain-containing protein [Paenibacillus sp. 2RAB27]|uniref:TetR-like C-terminal domain-containing protein n=1 Tax=Paenibacillus sp. 2RAB27 TaxID=3232991 RepID=UPI003F9A5FA6